LAELPAIVALINEAYLVESFFVAGPRIASETMADFIGAEEMFVLEAPQEQILATAHLRCHESSGHLGLISVLPTHQGQGLGKKIIAALEQVARTRGCTTMHLQVVNLRTELPPFYQRLGYYQTGCSEFADPQRSLQPVHFLEMQKFLAEA
jgi:GNAT superfamily N-acetyltransferase